MAVIRRLAPQKCPDCGAQGSLFIDDDRLLTCRLCGYKQKGDETQNPPDPPPRTAETDAQLAQRREQFNVSYRTPLTPDVDRWALTKFTSAMDYLHQGDYEAAIQSLKQALDSQHDFTDAHLWLGRLLADPAERREHYGAVIAETGHNLEAMRELMVLNGELSREAADRTLHNADSVVMEAGVAVAAQLVEIVCTNCGGTLQAEHGSAQITCQYCGHVEQVRSDAGYGMESFAMAMLKERGKAVQWRVGQHLLRCNNCGAERIITRRTLTDECPFCGSSHVVRADALESFRQPDGVIPFVVREHTAQEAVDKALKGVGERVKGWFSSNRVVRMTLTPVYIPYWFFDVTAQIRRTVQRKSSNQDAFSLGVGMASGTMDIGLGSATMPVEENFTDGISDIPYCAVESPPRKLVNRLRHYNLKSVKSYSPKLLAGFTAEIYTVDFQRASIEVRPEMGERFRTKHGHGETSEEIVRVSYFPQLMNFRLVLLPMWIATLHEADGDVRLGLVHGQKGQVVLGKAIASNA